MRGPGKTSRLTVGLRPRTLVSCAVLAAFGALASAQTAAPASPRASGPTVTILSPQNGAYLPEPNVHVVVTSQGLAIAPATEHRPGTAHHHLFLDVDVTPADSTIPAGMPGIIDLSRGDTEYTFENVVPGSHRLIDVLGDANHVPLKPMVADTVQFTVE
jgi:hypothetical protein